MVTDSVRPQGKVLRGPSLTIGKRGRKQIGDVVTYTVLLLGGVVSAAPFVWMVLASLQTIAEMYTLPPVFIPKVPQWINYDQVFVQQPFGLYLKNSFFVATCVMVGVLFTSSLAGYSFARLEWRGRDKIFLLYLSTMMLPEVVTLIPSFMLMKWFRWLDTYYALIVPFLVSPWGTFMMRQFMLAIPRDLEDAAEIDGCSPFRIYWNIILPVSLPVIATLGIFSFMGSWNSFLWPVVMLNSQRRYTVPIGLAAFRRPDLIEIPWNVIMAASTVSVVPVIVLFVAGQKYLVQGIVTTGLKGAA